MNIPKTTELYPKKINFMHLNYIFTYYIYICIVFCVDIYVYVYTQNNITSIICISTSEVYNT